MSTMRCRHCGGSDLASFVDLATSPPSNSYVTADALNAPELYYPLRVFVCPQCWLVQTEDFARFDEMFSDKYAYFSSFSASWLAHSEAYVDAMIERFALNSSSQVIEVASNDGYLLDFVKRADIPCLGIEPTASTAAVARDKGIEVTEQFFGAELGSKLATAGRSADLTAANNVLAHVPDINDFVRGFANVLKPAGVATFEFPHLMELVDNAQFDTIYHEHFSYLSLSAVDTIFSANGLHVFDVEEIPTHGGSLRVFAQRSDTGKHERTATCVALLDREGAAGIRSIDYYSGFQERADSIKNAFVEFLLDCKGKGRSVAAYGAAAKGNTLINYAGVRGDLIRWVVDRNPAKRGNFLPGSRIPIVDESLLGNEKPDYIVILPWNIATEVTEQLKYARDWGAKFVVAVPSLTVS